MPTTSSAYDGSFTNWVDAPGTPSTPGAADMNRLQNNQKWFNSLPAAILSRDADQLFNSSGAFADMNWNVLGLETDTSMVGTIGGTHFVQGIVFKYPGLWLVGTTIRTQYNNQAGAAQIQMVKSFQSGGGADIPIDQDMAIVQPITVPVVLKCTSPHTVSTTDVTNGAFLKVQYVQNSGGVGSIKADPSGWNVYPLLWAQYLGAGTV